MSILEEGIPHEEEGGELAKPATSAVDALALTIAHGEAKARGGERKLGKASEELLRKQSHMLDLQMEHLAEQRVAALKELQLRVLNQRLRVGLQILVVLIATVLGAGLLLMIRDAVASRSVVVEPFDTPPALASRGLSGKVVAGGVLDTLTRVQAATRANAVKRNLKDAWSGDIKVEVPETGISVGEIDRLLHERFGHDVHIDGDLVQTDAGGLALTVRGDAIAPKTFQGGAGDLDKLTTQAAEYIYGRSEPVLYASYLNQAGRYAESVAFLEDAFTWASDADRPDLANIWGNNLASVGKNAEAIAKYRLAVQLQPTFWKSWSNLVAGVPVVEDEEAGFRVGRQMFQAAAHAKTGAQFKPLNRANYDTLVQDWPASLQDNLFDVKANGAGGTQLQGAGPLLAETSARMHDWGAAERYLTESEPNDPYTKDERAMTAALRAMDGGDFAMAVAGLRDAYALWQTDPNLQFDNYDHPCYLALADAMTGAQAEADAIFDKLGRHLACKSFRADALDHAGDWAGAQAAYAAAAASAPDLPLPLHRWGLALLRHGDPAGAAAKFAAANRLGPHWADPLKGWGDALAAQGRWPEAAAKYADAAKYAPRWGQLHQAWAAALDRLGQREQAAAQRQAAAAVTG
jgi:Flp pilus assembly protein TadD